MTIFETGERLPTQRNSRLEKELAERNLRDSLEARGGIISSETDVIPELMEENDEPARNGVFNTIIRAADKGEVYFTVGPPNDRVSDPISEVRISTEPEQ